MVTVFLRKSNKIKKLSQIFFGKKLILERNICSLAWHEVAAVSFQNNPKFPFEM